MAGPSHQKSQNHCDPFIKASPGQMVQYISDAFPWNAYMKSDYLSNHEQKMSEIVFFQPS